MATFEHPINGHRVKATSILTPLWALLFGFFFFAYHGVWTHAVITFFLGPVLWPIIFFAWPVWVLASIIYALAAPSILRNHYLSHGWSSVQSDRGEAQTQNGGLGLGFTVLALAVVLAGAGSYRLVENWATPKTSSVITASTTSSQPTIVHVSAPENTSVLPAPPQGLPEIDIAKLCRKEAEAGNWVVQSCLGQEREALEQLRNQWSKLPAPVKEACLKRSQAANQGYWLIGACVDQELKAKGEGRITKTKSASSNSKPKQ